MIDARTLKASTQDLKVLLVDDEPSVRMQLQQLLSQLFVEVVAAEEGAQALAIWQQRPKGYFDLVLTDIRMPVMDGLTLALKLRQQDPEQCVLIISAHNQADYFKQAIEAGVDGFILKPVQSEQLYDILFKAAQGIQRRKDNQRYQAHLEQLVEERTRELHQQMITDRLTGLPNLTALQASLQSLKNAGMLLINLDNFDQINTVYGYQHGDWLLLGISRWLENFVPPGVSLFRIGADEFVLISQTMSPVQLKELAASLVTACPQQSFSIGEFETQMTLTLGMVHGQHGDLLRPARIALQEARQIGKSRFAVYQGSSPLEQRQTQTLQWMRNTRRAIREDALVPYFQPIVCNASGQISRYECLARIHLDGQVFTPNYFIEPALLSGLLPDITRAMLRKSFASFHQRKEGFSVNLSEVDFREGYLVDYLKELTRQYPGLAHKTTLEVLEEVSVEGADTVLQQLQALRELGFKIALDDFGSEKSNFSRLQSFPVDLIKIDGRFIRDLDQNPNSYKITRAITELARHLGAQVVAEFVHSPAIQACVQELGIEFSQGYHWGAPSQHPVFGKPAEHSL